MATVTLTPSEGGSGGRGGIKRQVQLPLNVVFAITMNGIKIRLWRSMVTASGIMLSIAFFAYVLTNLKTTPNMTSDETAKQIWLVIMSILVTIVGICNSMLMAVTERFREIGTMKCLGALDSFVTSLFLIEAVLMAVIASSAGWLVGFFVAVISHLVALGWVATWAHITPGIFFEVLGASLIFGIIATVGAAIPPALQAAKMPAAAALRTQI
jgi:putative ABC transport system permease protein